MSDFSAVGLVADVLQRVYGDATQTVLDRRAAEEVVEALRRAGWATLDEVAILIESAGGSITVPDLIAGDPRERCVMVTDDYAAGGRRFVVSSSSPGEVGSDV